MQQITHEKMQEIADLLYSGFRVFLHQETLEMISYPNEDRFESYNPSEWKEEIRTLRKQAHKYFKIEAMEANESFWMMEAFTATIEAEAVKAQLTGAIQRKRPFAHFKAQLSQLGDYRQMWFVFKQQKMLAWVEEQLGSISMQ